MSQTELGKALGITFQQIQKYEKGANRIGAGRLQQIANILSIPVTFFFDGMPEYTKRKSPDDGFSAIVNEFLSRREGIALANALSQISDVKLRWLIVDLAEAIAGRENDK
jgi:transcriptional regulator with XRE-family HTH domain